MLSFQMPKTAGGESRNERSTCRGNENCNLLPLCLCAQRDFTLYIPHNGHTVRRQTIKTGGKEMAKVELKQPIVKEIAEHLDGAASAVLVDYRGLTVEQDTQLRKQMREAGIVYKVYKNRMIKLAIKDTAFAELEKDLDGPTAIAITKGDATASARIISKFAKTADKLEFKSGVVEGTYFDAAGISAVANIPGREELLSKLLGSLQSPVTNLARVLNQIAEKGGACAAADETAAPAEAVAEETAAPAEAPAEEAAETPAE